MRKWSLFLCVIATTFAQAQKKQLSTEELLSGRLPKNFYNTLPSVLKWIDDEHVILNQKIHPDSAAKNYILDIKTGTFTNESAVKGKYDAGDGKYSQ